MDWTVYWFMLLVCFFIAGVAMFSGISGAAMLTPVFLIGFPLFHVPRLTTVAAIATSLFLETSGFGTGLYRYVRMKLADLKTAKSIVVLTLPLGAIGAVASRHVPVEVLKIVYGVAMLGLAWLLFSDKPAPAPVGAVERKGAAQGPGAMAVKSGAVGSREALMRPAVVAESEHVHPACALGEHRTILASGGHRFDFCAHGLRLQRMLSGAGAFIAGMISTGVGEATLPALVRRSHFPVPVAAATSTVIVASTVTGAAVTHLVQLLMEGGVRAIAWNLLVWAIPGSVIGALVGTKLEGRVSEKASRLFFSGLFLAIGLAFLLAFTVFRKLFA